MTDTRARPAAAGDDVVAYADGWHWWRTPWASEVIRYWYAGPDEWSDGLDADMIATGWVYRGPVLPPAAIEARDAEIARLREALDRLEMHAIQDARHWYSVPAGEWEQVFLAALAPPPASDAPAPAGWDEGTCNR